MSARIVMMGTPEFAVPSLEALLAAGYDVIGVFTQPDRPKGRGGKVQKSPVKQYAEQRQIPVFQPIKLRVDGMEALRALKPDFCVTAAFGQILSQEALDVPRGGTINVHASLLPRHRGAAPVQWAVLQGDEKTGITTMFTDRGMDTGDILLQAETPILPTDTAGSLLDRLSQIGAELLTETLHKLEHGDCPRVRQCEEESTYEPKLTKELGLLKPEEGRLACLRRVRAMNPWPCAYLPLRESVLKVWSAEDAGSDNGGRIPGTLLSADPRDGLIVAAADGAIKLCDIQAPNAKRMDSKAFLRGRPIEAGRLISEVSI